MKKIHKIGLLVFFIFIVLFIAKNQIIKSAIIVGAQKVVGTPVKIDKFSFGIFKQKISIKGLRIYNPEGFPKEVLVDIPEITVQYDLPALLKKKLHIPLLVINLKEVIIIKNKEGNLNVDSLKIAEQKDKAPKKQEEKKKESTEQMPMQIDVVTLSIGKVVYKDYSAGDQPTIEAFDVGIKEKTYKNITSAQQLAALVLTEAMRGTVIKSAALYGAATLLGVGFLPAGVAGVLIGKDSSQMDFKLDYDKVFDASVTVLKEMGKLTKKDKSSGVIKGKVDSSNVAIKIEKKNDKEVNVTVSARKYLVPAPKIAGGILHQIGERLK